MSITEKRTADGKSTYAEAGSSTPLVLLHAFPLSKAMWQPQLAALSDIARVLAVDLPGFGGSRGFDGAPSIDAMADRVAQFLDALHISEPIVLGGLSMGGYVSLAFARRHANRLRALILADTKADADDETAKANRDKMIALVQQSGSSAVVDQMIPRLIGADTRSHNPEIVAGTRLIGAAQTPAGIAAALQAMRDRPDASPSLASIPVPTLVVVGAQDEVTPLAKAEALQRAISGAQLVTISGAGHLSSLEQPDAFNAAMRTFIGGVR
jgi:pimeloyl-ACP methyl ester carboxylesterase